ncbi:DnaJ domain-containing protein [Metabacillus fastidiosus]|uniref:DnaJ domain-containing protein n=1 Tax=Metabacillus fastidiosus TaxID=1458 RepID=UPI002E2080FD|nr:DnaJ domain-containing protein [Metabacillus fastidiosus]
MDVKEVTEHLKRAGITESEQIVRRWIRQGRIKATLRTKKEGYQVEKADLLAFLKAHKMVSFESYEEVVNRLKEAEKRFAEERKRLMKDHDDDYRTYEKTFLENRQLKEQNKTLLRDKELLEINNRSLKRQVELLEMANSLNSSINVTQGNINSNISNLLGLSENATKQEIKKEFKYLLKALHPDRGGNERLFKVFNEHYKDFR